MPPRALDSAPASESHRAMGGDAPELTVRDRKELLEALLDALLEVDQAAALAIVAQAVKAGWSADDVRFGLITPALYEVGVRWQRAEIGVAEEHLATSVCEWLLFGLAGSALREPAAVIAADHIVLEARSLASELEMALA